MTAKPPPKTVKEVIRSHIPPKGVKRGKNIEGSELFDKEEIEEEEEDEDFYTYTLPYETKYLHMENLIHFS